MDSWDAPRAPPVAPLYDLGWHRHLLKAWTCRCAGRGILDWEVGWFLMKVSGIYRNGDDYVTSSINANDVLLDMIQQLIFVDSG